MKKQSIRVVSSLAAAALAAGILAPAGAATIGRVIPVAPPQYRDLGPDHMFKFTFTTLDDQADPTFNQLLGINNSGIISGYFGSGISGHPNQGYTLAPPYGQSNYTNENFPGSVQTQVTGLNNKNDTVGFWVDGKGVNRGFVQWNGVFTSYANPHTGKGTVNQILGINDSGIAVGFYTDGMTVNHGYTLNQATGVFNDVKVAGGTNLTASGINNLGDITGFYTSGSGMVVGFLIKNGHTSSFAFPNASATTPFGVNDKDQIVGSYVDSMGATHGFLLTNPLTKAHFRSLDDPNGVGTTVVNGINDKTQLVGFYVDGAGNTDGFIATP